MELILCHTTADFDTLGAAVGLTRLHPNSKILLSGGSHPTVREFLALYRGEIPLIDKRSVNPHKVRSLMITDTQNRARLGKIAEWLDLPNIENIIIYDHHTHAERDIPATEVFLEPVGSATTIVTEKLSEANISLTPAEATIMALGIHADTGSLTYDQSTARDAIALAWLMENGATLSVISEYIQPGLSPQLQNLLKIALEHLHQENIKGYQLGWVLLTTEGHVPGLSSLASSLTDITESDVFLLAHVYYSRESGAERLSVIGRSCINNLNLHHLLQKWGGGGHASAAAATLRDVTDSPRIMAEIVSELKTRLPQPITARELMSSPVRTIPPETTITEAHRMLLRYGHSGLSVVDTLGQLVGIISRRDLDIALHHGFGHAPVKGYMTPQLKTITPETTLQQIEELMVNYDIGRLPVLENDNLVGIVTRTDVLRELHQQQRPQRVDPGCIPGKTCTSIQHILEDNFNPQLWQVLSKLAKLAEEKKWQLYLIGGAVRDLLFMYQNHQLKTNHSLLLTDIDLVVDSCHQTSFCNNDQDPDDCQENYSPAVELAHALQAYYPGARVNIHGEFQTAALLWHNDSVLESLWIDIATARTEFYPYPAANPEVEASDLRQDLYRRDFTINALAVRLTAPRQGELLDFFGGLSDLGQRQIRVLHPNSFIEDPTRIYRAVRFAVRLGFNLEPQTEAYIRYAINSGVYDHEGHRIVSEPNTQHLPLPASASGSRHKNRRRPALETRLKMELKYILEASYWQPALQLLGSLGALRCLHPTLELTNDLWQQILLVDRCLHRFQGVRHLYTGPGAIFLPDWHIRLEVLIAHLAPEYRGLVAESLQLPLESIERLKHLETSKLYVEERLLQCEKPSHIFHLLKNYDLPILILMAAQCRRLMRQQIWQYLTQWALVRSPLDGNDLKNLGYQPGQQFKVILDDLLAATLDGIIFDRTSAYAYLANRYPYFA